MPTSSDKDGHRPAPQLLLRELTAGYGGTPIIRDVSIAVGLGEVVAIVGPNGAGKSTLLKAITGQIRSLRGSVRLAEADVTNMRGDLLARHGVGYVPQVRDVFDTLTVAENLEMGAYLLAKSELPERIHEVLAIFPALQKMRHRRAGTLSGGEHKMLAIGRVLMLRPTTLILDEPTSNLSVSLSKTVLNDYVRRTADAGTAILLVEQKAVAALEISDWAYLMMGGAIRLDGPAGELLDRPDFRQIFLGHVAKHIPSETAGTG
jgi:ABC-type branched-subunit amino acid transport system ATPase component